MHELSKSFIFEAAHTLQREIETSGSRRVHGHSYRATVSLRGVPDPASGMLLDLGFFKLELERVRQLLDHHLLDEVAGLGPATLENLSRFIFEQLRTSLPQISAVLVSRDMTGDACRYGVGDD